jgi:hypothetical protein
MLIAQGWVNKKVRVLALSRCQNGMDGWQVYVGEYDPNNGGTYETATWTCLNSSPNVVDLLYYSAFPEMVQWADGGKQVQAIQDTLIQVHQQLKQVALFVEQQYKAGVRLS